MIEQLGQFRARFVCIDCHPVEYLRVRLAVARMMNGSERYEDAKALLGFLLQEARRVLDSEEASPEIRESVERVVTLLEGCVKCAEKRVVYLF